MPQRLGDLRQPRAGPQHPGRRGVAQAVGAKLGQAGAPAGGPDHLADTAWAKPAPRCLQAHKHRTAAVGDPSAAAAQVVGNGLADIIG